MSERKTNPPPEPDPIEALFVRFEKRLDAMEESFLGRISVMFTAEQEVPILRDRLAALEERVAIAERQLRDTEPMSEPS